MIICKGAKVEIKVDASELFQPMIDCGATSYQAAIACIGLDLTLIFKELVKIYGNKTASMLWVAAHSAYDNVLVKGENKND